MKPHEELLELASGFVFGTLEDDELQAFQAHLEDGCRECEEEIARAAATADELVRGVAPSAPSDMLRRRLIARARGQVDESTAAAPTSPSEVSGGVDGRVHGAWRWAAMLAGVGFRVAGWGASRACRGPKLTKYKQYTFSVPVTR